MQQFGAKARFIRISPFKLRPLVDVVRGKKVADALGWLTTYPVKRAEPIKKMIQSAAANAKSRENIAVEDLIVKEIRVDHGPIIRYFKPGAMGRANIQRKRLSHMSVVVETKVAKQLSTDAKKGKSAEAKTKGKKVMAKDKVAKVKRTSTTKNKTTKED